MQYGVVSVALCGSNSSCGKLPGAYPMGSEYVVDGSVRDRR